MLYVHGTKDNANKKTIMTIISAAITLFLIMDPLGNIPIFLSVLDQVPPKKRRWIILRELLIALGVLVAFLFFGQHIMSGMMISGPALSIAGGVILFLIAIRMIFPGPRSLQNDEDSEDPFIVPLAIPFIAGPSAMAMVILFATREPDRIMEWLAALLIAWSIGGLILFYSDFLRKILKARGLRALARLMGMVLTTMAVQMLLNGLKEFFTSI
jgi:multiple antibiotic resistance protein